MAAPPVEGDSHLYFLPETARAVAAEIAEAGGVEVFFIGRRDRTGLVAEVESHAYGTAGEVPAIVGAAKPGDVIIHNHPSGGLMPSDADLAVSSMVGNMGIGSYIIDNGCARCRVVVRPSDPKRIEPVAAEVVLEALAGDSKLAATVGEFEDRPQQRDMALEILHAFNTGGAAAIEAGTGTGKSFAYLIPALLFALKNQERVVVSTNTINLQEQLLNKDIPAIRTALGKEFKAEIVKGRSNYVCLRKASFAREEAESLLDEDFRAEMKELLAWIEKTPTGDRAELPVPPRSEVWERVESEADNSLRVRCPFYEKCFFYNSRRRAARAELLIVNHALLLSDLAVRAESLNYTSAAVLPPYLRVVLDEAHHLEEQATNHFAREISRGGIRRMFGRLYRRDGTQRRGVLMTMMESLEEAVKKRQVDAGHPGIERLAGTVVHAVADIRESCDSLLESFAQEFMQLADLAMPQRRQSHQIRIVPSITEKPAWRERAVPSLEAMKREVARFVEMNRECIELLAELEGEAASAIQNPLLEWKAMIGRIGELRGQLQLFLGEDPEHCRWVELYLDAQGRLGVRIACAPVEVADVLHKALHSKMKTEVLTSATLTVDREFDFFLSRIGLARGVDAPPPDGEKAAPRRGVEPLQLGSPFDYARQVFLGVPSDLGDPRSRNFDASFHDMTTRAIAASGGRAFVLFTSYAQMERSFFACAPAIRKLGIDVFKQGDESRDRLLRRFRTDETSVLFATSSFWEGVDVRGRALELLILAKLPFAVPTEPLQQAQWEAIEARGGDPFDELVLPRAVIRFKQGFGRLIRSRTDRGAVLIADERVMTKGYGRRFLRSLPSVRVHHQPTADLLGLMQFFLQEPRG